jgi:hypothetical protein
VIVKIERNFGCRVVEANTSDYGHHFGGGEQYSGTTPDGGVCPVHLLFEFNVHDPTFPISVAGLSWLPLFFAFQYDGRPMSYLVHPDYAIEMLEVASSQYTPDFPYRGYPSSFLTKPVELVPITYEEQRALSLHRRLFENALCPCGLQPDDRHIIERIGTEFTRIGGYHDLLQGVTDVGCPNQGCELANYKYPVMETFASMWSEPITGIDVWNSGGEPIQIIYQICPECAAIRTFNLCT